MKKSKWFIGVIGHTGVVGSQVYQYFKELNYQVFGYSISGNNFPNSTWEEINNKCNIIFISVPTPHDFKKRKANFDIVENVLKKIKPVKIVVIKSTIWPGTTLNYQKKYSKLKILFNPEFLSRSSAKVDFRSPDRQLVGYTETSKNIAKDVLKILPKGKYNKIILAAEAELIKYAHNIYGVQNIIFANHLFEVCKKLKLNYEEVKNGFSASEYIGPGILRYMTIFHHDNNRGFGGPCFPKDIENYLEFCKFYGIPAELQTAAKKANVRILKSQGLTMAEAEKHF